MDIPSEVEGLGAFLAGDGAVGRGGVTAQREGVFAVLGSPVAGEVVEVGQAGLGEGGVGAPREGQGEGRRTEERFANHIASFLHKRGSGSSAQAPTLKLV